MAMGAAFKAAVNIGMLNLHLFAFPMERKNDFDKKELALGGVVAWLADGYRRWRGNQGDC